MFRLIDYVIAVIDYIHVCSDWLRVSGEPDGCNSSFQWDHIWVHC